MKKEDSVQQRNQRWKDIFPDLKPEGVWGRILRMSRCHAQLCSETLRPLGLRSVEADVLAALLYAGPPHELTPKDITAQCNRSPGAMTGILDALEARGLVSRRTQTHNRRSYLVTLTPAGQHLAREAFLARTAMEKQLLDVLSSKERKDLAALLKKVLADLEERGLL